MENKRKEQEVEKDPSLKDQMKKRLPIVKSH